MGEATTIRNGIDVDRPAETIEAIQAGSDATGFTFKATGTWLEIP